MRRRQFRSWLDRYRGWQRVDSRLCQFRYTVPASAVRCEFESFVADFVVHEDDLKGISSEEAEGRMQRTLAVIEACALGIERVWSKD